MRCVPVAERHRAEAEHPDQHGQAEAEHRPVEGNAPVRVDGPDRAQRAERGESHGHAHGQQRAQDDGAEGPDETVAERGARSGAERPHDAAVLVGPAQLAGDGLGGQDQADQRGDGPEPAQGVGLGPQGQFHLAHHPGGDVELADRTGREKVEDLPFHGGDIGGPVPQLQLVTDGRAGAGRHGHDLAHQRRGEDDKAVGPVDVVLDHGVVEHGNADHLEVGLQARP